MTEKDLSKRTYFPEGSTGHCFVDALSKRGIAYRYLSPDEITDHKMRHRKIVTFEINGVSYFFTGVCLHVCDSRGVEVPGRIIDGAVGSFVKRKDLVKSFLSKHGIGIPEGRAFLRGNQREAEDFFTAFGANFPHGVCVKPVSGHEGDNVHLGIRDLSSFRTAFGDVGKDYRRILVEETVLGSVYRFTCVGGRVIAIRLGVPANVIGDGRHRIAELIDIKNGERRRNPCLRRHVLRLGSGVYDLLNAARLSADSIPPLGQTVWLAATSNRHQGGDPIDVTDEIHLSYVNLIEEILRLFPGLILCGVDVAIVEPDFAATSDNYHVLEVNRCPGFSGHHYPWRGKPRDVAGAIIDFLTKARPVQVHFSEGTSGDCLAKALAERGIRFHYLTPDQITNCDRKLWTDKPVAAFNIGGTQYYFDGSFLRTSDPSGTAVPGPIIDESTAQKLASEHAINVPDCTPLTREVTRGAQVKFLESLATRGIAVRYLEPDEITNADLWTPKRIVAFNVNRTQYYFDGSCFRTGGPSGPVPGPIMESSLVRWFVKRKALVKSFLRDRAFNVPDGATFSREEQQDAEAFFQKLLPGLTAGVCVKPEYGKKGQLVRVAIRDLPAFREAFGSVATRYKRVLVEATVTGMVYRFVCLAGRVIAITYCRPANVEADGIHSIADLIHIKNARRRLLPNHRRHPLRLNSKKRRFLERAGFTVDSVPKADTLVFMSSSTNDWEGDTIDVTNQVHQSYIELAERIVGLFPGFILCGLDVVIEDIDLPMSKGNYFVLELNTGPQFADCHYPWYGPSRDVAGAILDHLACSPH